MRSSLDPAQRRNPLGLPFLQKSAMESQASESAEVQRPCCSESGGRVMAKPIQIATSAVQSTDHVQGYQSLYVLLDDGRIFESCTSMPWTEVVGPWATQPDPEELF